MFSKPYMWANHGVLMRGMQPDLDMLKEIQRAGVKTVVNLRQESEESRDLCWKLGLNYEFIPINDWGLPQSHQVKYFLNLMQDEKKHPVYIHCWAGVGRTGVMVSLFRMFQRDWTAEQAIKQSCLETPHCGMCKEQQDFLREMEKLKTT